VVDGDRRDDVGRAQGRRRFGLEALNVVAGAHARCLTPAWISRQAKQKPRRFRRGLWKSGSLRKSAGDGDAAIAEEIAVAAVDRLVGHAGRRSGGGGDCADRQRAAEADGERAAYP